MGGPRWPALRQAFCVVRRARVVLVASDGLSDPFDAGEGPADQNGLGLECFAMSDEPIDEVAGSWLFDLVWQLSQFAADRRDLAALLADLGLMTTELYDVGIPVEYRTRFVNPEGRVGVLFGLVEPPIPAAVVGPLSSIRLVSAKLLTLEELAFAMDRGPAGRRHLAQQFEAPLLVSSLRRPSASLAG